MSVWQRLKEKSFSFTGLLRILTLCAALVLIWCISYDTFEYDNPFSDDPLSMEIQFWVCIFFLFDIAIEFILSQNKKRYFFTYLLMFLACIPYLSILPYTNFHLDNEAIFCLRFLPLIRSTYALAIVIGWFTYSRTSTVFLTYMAVMFTAIYLSSLIFFVFEVNVNPGVKTYGDAVWWATMEAVTVGCNIEAVTLVGKILSVVVAILGMLILPMFTVYVTNIIGTVQKVAGLVSGHEELERERQERDKKMDENASAKNSTKH